MLSRKSTRENLSKNDSSKNSSLNSFNLFLLKLKDTSRLEPLKRSLGKRKISLNEKSIISNDFGKKVSIKFE